MNIINVLKLIILPLAAYMMGSVPWGLVLTKKFTSVDIYNSGSKNIGATNVRRTAGNFLGFLTLSGDILKGAVPVWISIILTDSMNLTFSHLYISLTGLAAFTGHLYPLFMKFKRGGKGVATAGGCFLVISPMAVLVSFLIFILFVCLTSRVSAGSLAAVAILPFAVLEFTSSNILAGCALIAGIWIYSRHKDNIKRLLSGTEPKI